jgi:peptidoglycan-N-acetylglucosamine deacetylase
MGLCDHTQTHDAQLGARPPGELARRLRESERTLTAAAGPGVPLRLFRAPEGRWSVPLQRAVARHGMWALGWSVDSRDWTRPGVGAIVAEVQRSVRPGSVILFHDGGGPREETVAALERLLPWLRRQGYTVEAPA